MQPALASLSETLQASPAWLAPYLPIADRVLQAADRRSVADALNAVCDDAAGIRFVDPATKPADEPYEAFIARTSCVPTRDNLHDLFNGLMWLTYPQTKRRLNRLQAQWIATHGITGSRGALRDALTLFDENAALLRAPATLIDSLRQRDWRALFVTHRSQWQSACLVAFGHALLEKLMRPRKAITAHVWIVDDLGDALLATALTVERLTAKPFVPLPVLGVPGWWPDNESPAFYEDADVFRPARLPM
jgi:Protein of unknown function (DUF3025)